MQPPEPPSPANHDDRPTIALIGASVRAAADSARRGGYRVIGIDRFGDTDTREICDEFYLLPAEEELARTAVQNVTLRQVGGWSQTPAWRSLTNSSGRPDRWRNFEDLEEFDSEPRIRFPPQIESNQIPPDGRWLRKRWDSCGGLGVRWARPTDDPKDSVLQRFIDGDSMGATFISDGEHTHCIGACQSLVTPIESLPMVYAGSIGPVTIDPTTVDALDQFAAALARARGMKGLFNIDFVLDQHDAAWILEVNPRWSASMEVIERNLRRQNPSLSLLEIGLRADPRQWAKVRCTEQPVHEKRIHFAEQSLVFERATWDARLQPGQTLHDIPADGTTIQRGEPICTVIGVKKGFAQSRRDR